MDTALRISSEIDLLFNLPKSHLAPTRKLTWIGFHWNSLTQTVSLSEEKWRCWKRVFQSIPVISMSQRQWESLLGSLNYAAEMIKLGQLRLQRLIFKGRSLFSMIDRDQLVLFPRHLTHLRIFWFREAIKSMSHWQDAGLGQNLPARRLRPMTESERKLWSNITLAGRRQCLFLRVSHIWGTHHKGLKCLFRLWLQDNHLESVMPWVLPNNNDRCFRLGLGFSN